MPWHATKIFKRCKTTDGVIGNWNQNSDGVQTNGILLITNLADGSRTSKFNGLIYNYFKYGNLMALGMTSYFNSNHNLLKSNKRSYHHICVVDDLRRQNVGLWLMYLLLERVAY